MFEKLKELLSNANSKYYNYKVSAILVCNDGTMFKGVNVETSSPGAGICAERNAMYSAISNGYKKEDFKELHVMVDDDNEAEPCFVCRQALVDFTLPDMPIFLYSRIGIEKILMVKELTPYPFNEEDLK
jgi:cytidine deaminase